MTYQFGKILWHQLLQSDNKIYFHAYRSDLLFMKRLVLMVKHLWSRRYLLTTTMKHIDAISPWTIYISLISKHQAKWTNCNKEIAPRYICCFSVAVWFELTIVVCNAIAIYQLVVFAKCISWTVLLDSLAIHCYYHSCMNFIKFQAISHISQIFHILLSTSLDVRLVFKVETLYTISMLRHCLKHLNTCFQEFKNYRWY